MKIIFDVTIGSRFVDSDYPSMPVGGEWKSITIESKETKNDFDMATSMLKEVIGDNVFHIWYWTWVS